MIPQGPAAEAIAELTLILTVLGSLVYLGFLVALAVSLRAGRSGNTQPVGDDPVGDQALGDESLGLSTRSSRRLVIGGGVLIPTAVIAIVFAWTLKTMAELPAGTAGDALTVEVVGERWQWNVRYPEDGVELTDELFIPVDTPVALELRSEDVIHSFWVPQLAGKLDALPDRTNTLVIEAGELGEFRGQCAEFCGLHHAEMTMVVVALSPDAFRDWLEAGGE